MGAPGINAFDEAIDACSKSFHSKARHQNSQNKFGMFLLRKKLTVDIYNHASLKFPCIKEKTVWAIVLKGTSYSAVTQSPFDHCLHKVRFCCAWQATISKGGQSCIANTAEIEGPVDHFSLQPNSLHGWKETLQSSSFSLPENGQAGSICRGSTQHIALLSLHGKSLILISSFFCLPSASIAT